MLGVPFVVVLNLTRMLAFMVLGIYLKPSGPHKENKSRCGCLAAIAGFGKSLCPFPVILFRTPGLSRGLVNRSFSVPSLPTPVRRLPIIDLLDPIIVLEVKSVNK